MSGWVRRVGLLVLGSLVAATCAAESDSRPPELASPALVYVHDGLGRLRAVADPSGDMAVYSYDAVGNVVSVARHPADELAVVEVVPRRVTAGDEVVVWGSGFSADPANNEVRVGGSVAEVTAATPFRLTVSVPEEAGSGPGSVSVSVSVSRSGVVATGAAEVEVVPSLVPVVDGFSPAVVAPGGPVQISGSNFTGDPLLDHVVVGGTTYATVTAASESSLEVTIPPTAPTGSLAVATPYGSARSEEILVVAPLGYAADQVGERERVVVDRPEAVPVTAGSVTLVTFVGTRGQRIDLRFGSDGLGCAQLAVGLADPAGVTLVDPQRDYLAQTLTPGPWCPTGVEEEAPSGLTLPASGRYTLTLALAPGRDQDGTATVDLQELPAADDAGNDDAGNDDAGNDEEGGAGDGGDEEGGAGSDGDDTGGDEGGDEGDAAGGAGDDGGLREPEEVAAGAEGVLDGVGWLPVDLGTGALVLEQVDMVVADDLLPVSLSRSHVAVPTGPALGAGVTDPAEFGLGAALEFDMALKPSSALQYVELVLPSGAPVVFDRTTEGLDRATAEFVHTATPTGFFGASITWSGAGWELRLPTGAVLDFAAEGPLRAVRDRNGNATTVRRNGETDVFGRTVGRTVRSVHSPTGRWLAFDYDDADRIVTARNDLGDAVTYGYEAGGRLASVHYAPGGGRDGGGFDVQYGYDERGLLSSVTRAGQTVTIGYDAAGRVAQQRLADGSGFAFSYATEVRPTEIEGVGVEAVTRAEVSDPRGILRRVDFVEGRWVSDTAAAGTGSEQVVTAERDPATGFVTAQVAPGGVRTGYRYDEEGNVVAVTGAEGSAAESRTTFAYAAGFLGLTAVASPGDRQDLDYDAAGNLRRASSYGVEVRYGYDGDGRLTSVTDGLGDRTRVTHELGHRVTVEDPAGGRASSFYDAAGRLAARTDAGGGTTTYRYDGFDRLRAVVDPLAGETALDYDAAGQVAAVTDAAGDRTAYAYDEQGRLVSRTDPAGAADQFAYDTAGNVVATTDRRGIRSTFSYDELGRLGVAAYGVDDAGRAESTVRYTYDAAGRLAEVEDTAYGLATFDYDDLDRLVRESTPYGAVSYTYDAAGRRRSLELDGEPPIALRRDRLGRIGHLDLPNDVRVDRRYDERGAVAVLDYAADGEAHGDLVYGYDATGRRASVDGALAAGSLPRSVAATRSGDEALDYDAAGNLVSDGTNSYTWDARGRLVAVDGDVHAEFGYDPFGRRVTKTMDGAVTHYTHDGDNIARTRTTDADETGIATAVYLTGPGLDELYARVVDGEATTYLTDAQGSVVGLVGSDHEITTRYRYDPYGRVTVDGGDGGNDPNPSTYTGRELDETGLLFLRARYYSPRLGRFISQDPIGFAGGDTNLYAYASGDPVTLTDPTGLAPAAPPQVVEVIAFAACGTVMGAAAKVYFDNFDELMAIYDTNDDGVVNPDDWLSGEALDAHSDLVLITLDRHQRENLEAFEIAITFCSIVLNLPSLTSFIARAPTTFGRFIEARFPQLATRIATRYPNTSAWLGLTARQQPWSVNFIGGRNNCINCVVAGDATLSGSPASALYAPRPQAASILERTFGGRFQQVSGPAAIEDALLQAGPGARGIVAGIRAPPSAGHVVNVVNEGGVIRFQDYQSGAAASFADQGYKQLYLLWTNVP